MKLLIVGGAGYIGSHMIKKLNKSGHDVVVLDNLTTGFREQVFFGELIVGDLGDANLLESLFIKHKFDGVMHFAACSLVGESVLHPGKYYRNNVANTLNLLNVMVRHKVKCFIFSSTAATFGEPQYTPIDEAHPQHPINPYGMSKLMVEQILADFAVAYGLNSVALRYFNACGADPEGFIGECHDPETHLIPIILQAASGRRETVTIFGRDYTTNDGTCVRDYVHVEDLCDAHALALEAIISGRLSGACAYNLGNGAGFSVQQVVDAVQRVVAEDNREIVVVEGERRAGDPANLVADSSLVKQVLGWSPQYTGLETIIRHAWAWEKKMHNIE